MLTRLSLFVVLLAAAVVPAVAQNLPNSRYVVYSGVLVGLPQGAPPTVTIMVDSATGQAWMLTVADGVIKWVSVPYSDVTPPNVLPPQLSLEELLKRYGQ